jgi:hypothetical protein
MPFRYLGEAFKIAKENNILQWTGFGFEATFIRHIDFPETRSSVMFGISGTRSFVSTLCQCKILTSAQSKLRFELHFAIAVNISGKLEAPFRLCVGAIF